MTEDDRDGIEHAYKEAQRQNLWEQKSESRKRSLDIMRLNIHNCNVPIYLDLVNTVSTFKYVIDYKVNSELYVEQSPDEMVEEYTNEFIQCTKDSLMSKTSALYFVKDTFELKFIMDNLVVYE